MEALVAGEQIEFGFGGDLGYRRLRIAGPGGDNFFIGLQPDRGPERRKRKLARDLRDRLGVPDKIRPLHVTMQGLGWHEDPRSALLVETMDALSTVRFEPFLLTFDRVMGFRRANGRWPLVICCSQRCDGLFDVQQKIFEARRQPGITVVQAPAFTPHMTLFYTRSKMREESLDMPIEWIVRSFCLIRSYHGETRHQVLWP